MHRTTNPCTNFVLLHTGRCATFLFRNPDRRRGVSIRGRSDLPSTPSPMLEGTLANTMPRGTTLAGMHSASDVLGDEAIASGGSFHYNDLAASVDVGTGGPVRMAKPADFSGVSAVARTASYYDAVSSDPNKKKVRALAHSITSHHDVICTRCARIASHHTSASFHTSYTHRITSHFTRTLLLRTHIALHNTTPGHGQRSTRQVEAGQVWLQLVRVCQSEGEGSPQVRWVLPLLMACAFSLPFGLIFHGHCHHYHHRSPDLPDTCAWTGATHVRTCTP